MTGPDSLPGAGSTRTTVRGPPAGQPWLATSGGPRGSCLHQQLRFLFCQALIQYLISTFTKFVIFLRKLNKNVKSLRMR